MKRKIITTGDGSKTIQIEAWNEQYHSIHGAIQEAQHVFIKMGLLYVLNENFSKAPSELSVLEIGFGTGLNAFITYLETEKLNQNIYYNGVEAYPVSETEWQVLNYPEQLGVSKSASVFNKMHNATWNKTQVLSSHFTMHK